MPKIEINLQYLQILKTNFITGINCGKFSFGIKCSCNIPFWNEILFM